MYMRICNFICDMSRTCMTMLSIIVLLLVFLKTSMFIPGKCLASCRDSFRAIGALDRTGDGRLHFFEFLGAMIAAGRIPHQSRNQWGWNALGISWNRWNRASPSWRP